MMGFFALATRSELLSSHNSEESVMTITFVVFGPSEAGRNVLTRLTSAHGGRQDFNVISVSTADEIELAISEGEIGPCRLLFSLYVPGSEGQYVGDSEFHAFGRKLLSGISKSDWGNPETNTIADKSTGQVTLMYFWPKAVSANVIGLASALQRSFEANGGVM
jgi:hypothetical protein